MCQAVDEMRKDWKAEGKAEFMLQLLCSRGEVSEYMDDKIIGVKNLDTLDMWFRKAIRVETVQQFEEEIMKDG